MINNHNFGQGNQIIIKNNFRSSAQKNRVVYLEMFFVGSDFPFPVDGVDGKELNRFVFILALNFGKLRQRRNTFASAGFPEVNNYNFFILISTKCYLPVFPDNRQGEIFRLLAGKVVGSGNQGASHAELYKKSCCDNQCSFSQIASSLWVLVSILFGC